MGIWGGVKRPSKVDYWPCQTGPAHLLVSLGCTTLSMLLNFPPQGPCPGHALCLECPHLGNFWPQFRYHFLPEAPLPYTYHYHSSLQ